MQHYIGILLRAYTPLTAFDADGRHKFIASVMQQKSRRRSDRTVRLWNTRESFRPCIRSTYIVKVICIGKPVADLAKNIKVSVNAVLKSHCKRETQIH